MQTTSSKRVGAPDAHRRRPDRMAFAGIFTATLTAFLAIGAVLPVLPRYVRGPVGAGDLAVGVVVGAFAFTAVVGRPIAGRLADAYGRRTIVVVGLLISAAAGLLYLVPAGVPGLVIARLALGIGDGWVFTAGLSWTVDLVASERRGQAIGAFGLAVWGGLAAGPLVGEALFAIGSYELVFIGSAVLPALGALIARRVPDAHVPSPARGRQPLVPAGIAAPGAALMLANVGYATMGAFAVLLLADRGLGHGALVYASFALAVVGARLLLGRLPDLLGPHPSAAGAAIAEAAGLAILGSATSLPVALAGAVLVGTGFSLLFPSLALIAVARVGDERRATAIGAFTAFGDVGVGLGSPLVGAVAALAGYPGAFMAAAALAAAGAAVTLVLGRGAHRHPVPRHPVETQPG